MNILLQGNVALMGGNSNVQDSSNDTEGRTAHGKPEFRWE